MKHLNQELVELTGYSMEEKVEIAKNHLLPRQMANHGLGKQLISIDDHTILQIVSGYTRESGVRNLEREISSLCRNVAVSYSTAIENGRVSHFDPVISDIRIVDILGAPRYERDKIESDLVPGVATGLAWSPTGGGLLFVEVVYYDGTGQVKLTGMQFLPRKTWNSNS